MHGKLQARPCPDPVVLVSQVEPHASIRGRQRREDMQMTCIYIISTFWKCVKELGDILAFCPNWKVSLLTFPNWQPNRPLLNNGSNIPFTSWIFSRIAFVDAKRMLKQKYTKATVKMASPFWISMFRRPAPWVKEGPTTRVLKTGSNSIATPWYFIGNISHLQINFLAICWPTGGEDPVAKLIRHIRGFLYLG